MLKIRLQRVGRKHEPSFRLVLTDSKNSTKSGRFKEVLGSYDPRKSMDTLNAERIKYWISQGAILTNTVHNLLVTHKIITAPKINVSAVSKKVSIAEKAPMPEETETPTSPTESPNKSSEEMTEGATIEPVVEEETV